MEFARSNDMIVVTHDLDFGHMLAASHGKRPSVVQIRAEDVRPASIGFQVIAALTQMAADLESGALMTFDAGRARIRFLPLLPRTNDEDPQ
jgi:predicted nuclease of predicted toxin-antitoxin system